MVGIEFSQEELQALTRTQIMVLLDYYELKYPKRAGKEKLIKILDEFYHPEGEIVEYNEQGEEIQMSVRIRRIKESQKNVR